MTEHIKVYQGSQLWEDIQKLDALYSELLWEPDDELIFTHDGEQIIISRKTNWILTRDLPADKIVGRFSIMIKVIDDFLNQEDFESVKNLCLEYNEADSAYPKPLSLYYTKNGISCLPIDYEKVKRYCESIEVVTREYRPIYHGIELWVNNNTSVGWHYDKDEHTYVTTGRTRLADLSTVFYTHVDIQEGGLFLHDGGSVEPKPNRLIIFSKGMMHRVEPFVGTRWSVAANLWEEPIVIK